MPRIMTLDPMGISHIPSRAQSVSIIDRFYCAKLMISLKIRIGVFAINRITGVITVSGTLDSETLDRWVLRTSSSVRIEYIIIYVCCLTALGTSLMWRPLMEVFPGALEWLRLLSEWSMSMITVQGLIGVSILKKYQKVCIMLYHELYVTYNIFL